MFINCTSVIQAIFDEKHYFIVLKVSISNKVCTFLIDTQADLTLIKISSISPRTLLDVTDLIDITGITEDPITTLGCVRSELGNDSFQTNFPIHVVPEEFNIPSDGIIGKDFMKRFRCSLSYEDMTFRFYLEGKLVVIPILEGPEEDTMVLPIRSEVIRQFNLRQMIVEPQLVDSCEISTGVFVARTIINSSRPLVRVLNTTAPATAVDEGSSNAEKMRNVLKGMSLITSIDIVRYSSASDRSRTESVRNDAHNHHGGVTLNCVYEFANSPIHFHLPIRTLISTVPNSLGFQNLINPQ